MPGYHILTRVAVWQGKKVFAFTKPGDITAQQFATQLGVYRSGDTTISPSEKLDAAILFAPAGELVPEALAIMDKDGQVICGGIHMSTIASFSYNLLWEERMIRSVDNLTRADGHDFFEMLKEIPVQTETIPFTGCQPGPWRNV